MQVPNLRLKKHHHWKWHHHIQFPKWLKEQFAELYWRQYGIRTIVTRSFNHIGIGQSDKAAISSFCKQIANSSTKSLTDIHVGNLNVYRDFTNVRDIVRAYRLLIESKCSQGVYNVGSGEAVKLSDILEYIIKTSKKKYKYCCRQK